MKKDKIERLVAYVLSNIGSCPHLPLGDCGICIGKWIRDGIRKVEEAK